MKKLVILTIPIIISSLILGPNIVLAQDDDDDPTATSSATDRRNELRDQMEAKREEMEERLKEAREKMASTTRPDKDGATTTRDDIRNKMQERSVEVREEIRQKLADRFSDRLSQYTRLIVQRFEAAIERLEKLAERINARLEKLAERGIDTTEANVLLETARVEITEAKTLVGNLPTELEALLADGLTKEDFAAARQLFGNAKTEIKEAHLALVAVIRNIKAGLNMDNNDSDGDDETATTSDSNSDDN